MPLVFLAHQAPLLPIVRRWPGRVDGLALVVGTMAPDFAYVFTGTPLRISAHAFPALATFCVPATVLVAWIVARVLAPVVPDHLPECGGFRLRDYRGVAPWRFRPVATVVSAFLGAASHAALDQLTHGYGWPAQHFEWYRTPLFEVEFLHRPWTWYRVVQYAGHLGLTLLALVLLRRYGRERWLEGAARTVPAAVPTRASQLVLWGAALAGGACALALVLAFPRDSSAALLRVSAGLFVGLALGALAVRSSTRVRARAPG